VATGSMPNGSRTVGQAGTPGRRLPPPPGPGLRTPGAGRCPVGSPEPRLYPFKRANRMLYSSPLYRVLYLSALYRQ
jgi:hypothetical protein